QAQAQLDALALRLGRQFNEAAGIRLVPLHRSGMNEVGARVSWMTLALAAFVLLIACINLAGVQLARQAGRGHEQAIPVALGGGRAQLVRQALVESLVLGLAGAGLGLLMASWCTALLSTRMFIAGRLGLPVPIDREAMAVALASALAVMVGAGVGPALLGA